MIEMALMPCKNLHSMSPIRAKSSSRPKYSVRYLHCGRWSCSSCDSETEQQNKLPNSEKFLNGTSTQRRRRRRFRIDKVRCVGANPLYSALSQCSGKFVAPENYSHTQQYGLGLRLRIGLNLGLGLGVGLRLELGLGLKLRLRLGLALVTL